MNKMQPFQGILTDFIRESAQILEEFQAQCQSIAYELPDLDLTKEYPSFKYCPAEGRAEVFNAATTRDIEIEILESAKKSPKALLLSGHFINKVKTNLSVKGMSATKAKIQKAIEKLKSEGRIEFPDINE